MLFIFWFGAAAMAIGQDLSGRYQATLDIRPENRQTLLIIVAGDAAPVSGSIGPDQQHRLYFSGATIRENTIRSLPPASTPHSISTEQT